MGEKTDLNNMAAETATDRGKDGLSKKYIAAVPLAACVVLYFIEQSIGVNYGIKTIIKIVMFAGFPLLYIKVIAKEHISEALRVKKVKKGSLKAGLLAGLIFFAIVLGAYFILKGQIDLDKISGELQSKLKVTPVNFIFIGLYITLGNSFLEEFFFRGFIFLNLYRSGSKRQGYIYSSVLFGLYHIAIFKTWFTLPVTLLALLGLITVGFLFNWMDTKSDNFINSWISHAFADTAVIMIGMKMFGIL